MGDFSVVINHLGSASSTYPLKSFADSLTGGFCEQSRSEHPHTGCGCGQGCISLEWVPGPGVADLYVKYMVYVLIHTCGLQESGQMLCSVF